MVELAVLLRCKSRTWQLKGVLNQCLIDLPEEGITPHIILMPDDPTPEVEDIVREYSAYDNVYIVYPRKCEGHRWAKTGMEGLNIGMEYIDKYLPNITHVSLHDDDQIMGIGWRGKIKACLEDKDTLAWLGVCLYIWSDMPDTEPMVNLNQFHYSPIFFRYIKGDRFPTDGRSVHVTTHIQKRILRNKYRKRTLPFFIYDYGVTNYTALQRKEMVERMNKAGKDDMYTQSFVDTPQLMELSYIIKEDIPPIEVAKMQMKNKGLLR